MVPQLRVAYSMREIIELLKGLNKEKKTFYVWQNDQGHRSKVDCYIDKIDQGAGSFSIRPLDPTYKFEFEKDLVLYFKGDEKGMLFKQEIIVATKDVIILKIPREMRLIEKRASPRKVFDFYDERKMSIAKYSYESTKPRRFDLILLDYSKTGVAFFVTGQQILTFNVGDTIYLIELDGVKIKKPHAGVIKYITRFVGLQEETRGHRVGVQFNTPLPDELI